MKPLRRPFADWVEGWIVPAWEDYGWAFRLIPAGIALLGILWPFIQDFLIRLGLLLVIGVAIVIGIEMIRRARAHEIKRRREAGLCLNCAYDLRATPERCPECGMEVVRH